MQSFPKVLECISDLSKDQIEKLIHSANRLKSGYVPVGSRNLGRKFTPIVATSFLENSTRTKHSFAIAIKKLGAMYIDFNADTSSLKKGENLEETLLTLHYQGVDLCIIRTSVSGELNQFKKDPPIAIINGGDGINEHPTQALLDLFTMFEEGIDINGKTMAIIGDCKHSRVGHSLTSLIPMFGGKIIFCGPKECLPEDIPANCEATTNVDEAILKSDVLYTLRIQKERHSQKAAYYDNYEEEFGVNLKRLQRLDKKIPVFHPGPVNIGVELDYETIKSDLYLGYKQVTNSVFMRMAILKAMLIDA
ncbi:MAG: aspartate carbamoyltransferase catalytic subunit [Bdellovibrionales bacterium]|nr:aspartate carbamoyltransferase catalytic subunit [Bdellovibrionales bacterium]